MKMKVHKKEYFSRENSYQLHLYKRTEECNLMFYSQVKEEEEGFIGDVTATNLMDRRK